MPARYSAPSLADQLPDIAPERPGIDRAGAVDAPAAIAALLAITRPQEPGYPHRCQPGGCGTGAPEIQARVEGECQLRLPRGQPDRAGSARLFLGGPRVRPAPVHSTRQDPQVQSAIADTEAVRTEKMLALRNMVASFESQYARLQRLEQRRQLYWTRLLPQMEQQAEASLSAYTRDAGDFAEVVRARIAELNARISGAILI